MTASYDQGVLTVKFPVAARAKPRRIEPGSRVAHRCATPTRCLATKPLPDRHETSRHDDKEPGLAVPT